MSGFYRWTFIALVTITCQGQSAFRPIASSQPRIASAPRMPEHFSECESDQCESGGALGKWTLDGKTGQGVWRDGERAELVVETFDGRNVTIIRRDTDDSYLGLTGIYTGIFSGDRIDGTVTWEWEGRPEDKPQTGKWFAIVRNALFDAKLPDTKSDCAVVPGHPEAAVAPLHAATYFADLNDLEEAFCWVQAAAVDDYDLKGAGLLAVMYGGGVGVPQDAKKAVRWALIAAERGHPLPEEVRDSIVWAAAGEDDPVDLMTEALDHGGSVFIQRVRRYSATGKNPDDTLFTTVFRVLLRDNEIPVTGEENWLAKCAVNDPYTYAANQCEGDAGDD